MDASQRRRRLVTGQLLLTQAITAGQELSLSDVEHRAQALLETIH